MADDPKKNPNQRFDNNPEKKEGQRSARDEQDPSKRNPSRQESDEEHEQQGGQRRAS